MSTPPLDARIFVHEFPLRRITRMTARPTMVLKRAVIVLNEMIIPARSAFLPSCPDPQYRISPTWDIHCQEPPPVLGTTSRVVSVVSSRGQAITQCCSILGNHVAGDPVEYNIFTVSGVASVS